MWTAVETEAWLKSDASWIGGLFFFFPSPFTPSCDCCFFIPQTLLPHDPPLLALTIFLTFFFLLLSRVSTFLPFPACGSNFPFYQEVTIRTITDEAVTRYQTIHSPYFTLSPPHLCEVGPTPTHFLFFNQETEIRAKESVQDGSARGRDGATPYQSLH